MTIQRVGLIWLLSVFGGIFPDTPQEVTLMTTERTGLMLEFICVCWHLLGAATGPAAPKRLPWDHSPDRQ